MSEMNISQGQPPNEGFRLFPDLPTELRLKIINLAARHSRVIELEAGHITEEANWVRVTPRSRGIPPILLVNREAREEAMKHYTVVSFDRATHFIGSQESNIYFNAAVDVLLLGENTCITTVLDTIRLHQDIQNIALFCCSRGEECCNFDNQTTGVVGGTNYLQALHGFDPSVTNHEYRFGGCEGLKNIYFVVKSALWPQRVGKIDPTTVFRPATSTGLTKAQIRFHSNLERQIRHVNDEIELGALGGNIWVGEKKPTISFVSFSKTRGSRRGGGYGGDGYGIGRYGGGGYGGGGCGGSCDGMVVSRKELLKLTSKGSKFVKGVERSTGCTIEIPGEMHQYQDHREIGFCGLKGNVSTAKRCIEERLWKL